MTVLFDIVAFLAALGPLIIFHELGHYSVGRLFGVRALRFSIGFGSPSILRWRSRPESTEWVLAPIPLGGYVSFLNARDVEPGEFTEAELLQAFDRKPVWARTLIILAGPCANLLLAILLYWGLGMSGSLEPQAILDTPPVASRAAAAGIQADDEVLAVDDTPVRSLPDLRWRLLSHAVDGDAVTLRVRTAGAVSRLVTLNLAGLPEKDLDGDFLEHLGLRLRYPPARVKAVEKGAPADQAGLAVGDEVEAVDGIPTPTGAAFSNAIRDHAGRPAVLTVERAGHRLSLTVDPALAPDPAHPGQHIGRIGVGLAPPPFVTVRYDFLESGSHAVAQTWQTIHLTFSMVGKMIRGEASIKNLSGPATIADYAGQAAHGGWAVFLNLVAFISISIGVMNLLPIPVLDGGHLLYYLVEILKGRPPSDRFLEFSSRAGLVMIVGLMMVALYNDVSRLLF